MHPTKGLAGRARYPVAVPLVRQVARSSSPISSSPLSTTVFSAVDDKSNESAKPEINTNNTNDNHGKTKHCLSFLSSSIESYTMTLITTLIEGSTDIGASESTTLPGFITSFDQSRRTEYGRSSSMDNLRGMTTGEDSQSSTKDSLFIGGASLGDDPFMATPARPQSAMSTITPIPQSHMLYRAQLALAHPTSVITPRSDRINQEITENNCQAYFSPAACLFVANLKNDVPDDQLQLAVKQAFEVFGKCYIKIRRDRNKMPNAFVQYEEEKVAHEALALTKGLIISGRPIRCEIAQVHRSVFVSRTTGGPVTEDEARQLMEVYGPIERVEPGGVADQELGSLPEGTWVKFQFLHDFEDAVKGMEHNDIYRVIIPPKKNRPSMTTASPTPFAPRHAAIDTKAVFVGNLPQGLTDDELKGLFSQYGGVNSARVVHKENSFGFVYFYDSESVKKSLVEMINVGGNVLRVEPKYCGRRSTQAVTPAPTMRHANTSDPDSILNVIHAQALNMGLPDHLAAQILAIKNTQYHFAAPPYVPMYGNRHFGTPPFTSPGGGGGPDMIMTSPTPMMYPPGYGGGFGEPGASNQYGQ